MCEPILFLQLANYRVCIFLPPSSQVCQISTLAQDVRGLQQARRSAEKVAGCSG